MATWPFTQSPDNLNSSLPSSYSARKTTQAKQHRKDLNLLYCKSPRYKRMHVIDLKAPSSDYRELIEGLMWHQLSILIQLCTGDVQLDWHLYNIGVAASPICPACNKKEETVWHFLLSCITHVKHCQVMINTLCWDTLSISKLLSDAVCVLHILNHISATKRFHPCSNTSHNPPHNSQDPQ